MSQYNVLIAEDERIIALDLKLYLQKNNNIIATITTTSEDLISQYKHCLPNLIIVDVDLIGTDSNLMLGILESLEVPIIFISGYSKLDMGIGFDFLSKHEVLEKPIEHSELLYLANKFFESN